MLRSGSRVKTLDKYFLVLFIAVAFSLFFVSRNIQRESERIALEFAVEQASRGSNVLLQVVSKQVLSGNLRTAWKQINNAVDKDGLVAFLILDDNDEVLVRDIETEGFLRTLAASRRWIPHRRGSDIEVLASAERDFLLIKCSLSQGGASTPSFSVKFLYSLSEFQSQVMAKHRRAAWFGTSALLLVALAAFVLMRTGFGHAVRSISEGIGALLRGEERSRFVNGLLEDYLPSSVVLEEFRARFEDTKRDLRDKERVAAENRVARQVAHDIRSPLAALRSFALKVGEAPEDQHLILDAAIRRIHDITADLLAGRSAGPGLAASLAGAGSPGAGPTAPTLLLAAIEAVVSEKRYQHQASGRFAIEDVSERAISNCVVGMSAVELQRILSNLLNNALESMPDGGSVRISARAVGEAIEIAVMDCGKGIPPELLPLLGRTGATFGKPGGSGLGLHHAITAVECAGGRLEIESQLGKGTTVRIFLPRADALPAHADCPIAAILIDDDPLVRMNWTLAAKRAGKALKAYADAPSFIRDAGGTAKDTPVYIDSDLGEGAKGEEAAKKLHALGFTELFLATGHDPASFPPLPHIKGIRGKEPPWV